ncbi:hypothetical protein [Empedobacter sp. UBA3239]|nr:hypothetical protein [Empedobacter sp. UBA3239]
MKTISANSTYTEVKHFITSFFNEYLKIEMQDVKFYLHPLGFIYSRLYSSENEQLRIHIWLKDYKKKNDFYIHDHYYDLNSWILLGEIKDLLYDISEKENSGEFIIYEGSYNENENYRYLKPSNLFCDILKTEERYFTKGDKYFIQKRKYHSNEIMFNDSDYACTLVLTQNPNKIHSPKVLSKIKKSEIIEETPSLISYSDMKLIIETLSSKL